MKEARQNLLNGMSETRLNLMNVFLIALACIIGCLTDQVVLCIGMMYLGVVIALISVLSCRKKQPHCENVTGQVVEFKKEPSTRYSFISDDYKYEIDAMWIFVEITDSLVSFRRIKDGPNFLIGTALDREVKHDTYHDRPARGERGQLTYILNQEGQQVFFFRQRSEKEIVDYEISATNVQVRLLSEGLVIREGKIVRQHSSGEVNR